MVSAILLGGALLIGGLLAVQAAANLQLTKAVGSPYGGATVQLWVAAGLLVALTVAVGASGALVRLGDVPGWYLLGGLASPLYITSGILLFPRLGALAAGGLFVTGQMLASVALDLTGGIGVPLRPVGVGVVVGSAAVLAGMLLVVRGARIPRAAASSVRSRGLTPSTVDRGPTPDRRPAVGWLLLGLAAGAALPVQGAVNARLRAATDEPIAVALVSFLVAAVTISLVLVALVALGRTPPPRRPTAAMPWWGWIGGLCAAGYVTGTFLLIPLIGAAVAVALTVTGQQVVAAVLDARGWLLMPRRPMTAVRWGGLLLLVAGSLLVQLR